MAVGRAPADRGPVPAASTAVVKVGTSSITSEQGELDDESVMRLCDGVAAPGGRAATRSCWCARARSRVGLPALGLARPVPPTSAPSRRWPRSASLC